MNSRMTQNEAPLLLKEKSWNQRVPPALAIAHLQLWRHIPIQ